MTDVFAYAKNDVFDATTTNTELVQLYVMFIYIYIFYAYLDISYGPHPGSPCGRPLPVSFCSRFQNMSTERNYKTEALYIEVWRQ